MGHICIDPIFSFYTASIPDILDLRRRCHMIRKRYAVGALLVFVGGIAIANANPDINGDGVVNSTDLAQLLAAWGDDPPPSVQLELVQPFGGVVPIIEVVNPRPEGGPFDNQAHTVHYVDINHVVAVRRQGTFDARVILTSASASSVSSYAIDSPEPFESVWQRIAPLKGWPSTPPPAFFDAP